MKSSEARQYAIYLRKSRADLDAEALGQGETLARHRAALLELAGRSGFAVGEIYHEIVSGDSIEARPEMLRLLSDVENGRWAGVLCMDIDRLARGDSADQARISRTFRIARTLIITPARVYNTTLDSDEEYVDFELFMARREYKAISRRIMRGRIAAAKEGHFIGSTPPFGYDKVKLEKGRGFTLEPNSESETVRLIFAMCINGAGSRSIARRLDEMGLRPRSGGVWSGASVADILRNPVYCGKIRWQFRREESFSRNGVITRRRSKNHDCIMADGLHPAIISESDFDRAQQLISCRREPPKKSSAELRNPLSGLIYCGLCGAMMTRLGSGAHNRSDILRCPNRSCANVSSKLHLVERALVDGLSEWLGGCRVNIGCEPPEDISAKLAAAGAERLRSELSGLSAQRERIFSLLENGIYSPQEFRERLSALEQRQEQLSKRLEQSKRDIAEAERSRSLYAKLTPCSADIMEIYACLSPAEKNRLLKTIVGKAFYIKSERNSRRQPDKCGFTLDILPLVTWNRNS